MLTHPIVFKTITFWVFRYGYLTGNPYLNKLTKSENNPVIKTKLLKITKFRAMSKHPLF